MSEFRDEVEKKVPEAEWAEVARNAEMDVEALKEMIITDLEKVEPSETVKTIKPVITHSRSPLAKSVEECPIYEEFSFSVYNTVGIGGEVQVCKKDGKWYLYAKAYVTWNNRPLKDLTLELGKTPYCSGIGQGDGTKHVENSAQGGSLTVLVVHADLCIHVYCNGGKLCIQFHCRGGLWVPFKGWTYGIAEPDPLCFAFPTC